jgi:hypothetical protein
MTAPKREIQYLVLPNATNPYLLARVRWPDVYQAISPVRPGWQDDPGLFDLPYAPNSTKVTYEGAALIATEWGAELPSPEGDQPSGLSMIRRLPSDWSALSAAERRAWSILDERPAKAARPVKAALPAIAARPAEVVRAAAAAMAWARRWGRTPVEPVAVEATALVRAPIANESTVVIAFRSRQVTRRTLQEVELTEARESALAAVEPA